MFRRAFVASAVLLSACSLQYVPPSRSVAASDDHAAHMSAADRTPPPTARGPLSAQQGTPGVPASNMSAPARLQASPRHGEWVKIPWEAGSADSLMAWIVYPSSNRKAPV
ncbi:MAG: hypothetical protein ABIT38_17290, partial [Gemmatimonadaceae bacterium]